MKPGDRLRIERVPYAVHSIEGDRVLLHRVRRGIGRDRFDAWLRARRWRRPSVSADFIVDMKTGRAIHNYQMLALGVPSKRIERLHATLPLMKVGEK